MSADITVVVLQTPSVSGAGYEFRVAEVQFRENAESIEVRFLRRLMVDTIAQIEVFSVSEPYGMSAEEKAWEAARALAVEIRRTAVLKYGIRSVALSTPFP